MRKVFWGMGAALAIVSTAAIASVSFDEATGLGFVGKGDVQVLYGWNDAAFQRNASGLTFKVVRESSYEATCTWTTGEGTRGEKIHTKTRTRSYGVNATVAYDLRKNSNGKSTGINLGGYSTPLESGDAIPVVGDACLGEGTGATYTAVTLVSETGSGLQVTYGGVSFPLPNTPVI